MPRKSMTLGRHENEAHKAGHEAIPAPSSNTRLVLSGGEGYVDFRIGMCNKSFTRQYLEAL